MPAIKIEVNLSDRQIEQAKRFARQWDPENPDDWQACVEAVAIAGIVKRIEEAEEPGEPEPFKAARLTDPPFRSAY